MATKKMTLEDFDNLVSSAVDAALDYLYQSDLIEDDDETWAEATARGREAVRSEFEGMEDA